jgi:GNAT superfamily N-acetyltransferase
VSRAGGAAEGAGGTDPGLAAFSITPAGDQDLPFLREMLYEAAFWRPEAGGSREAGASPGADGSPGAGGPPRAGGSSDGGGSPRPSVGEAVASPALALYLDAWGRAGDRALLARQGARPLGAVWYRLFTADRPGYGYVDDETPELSIGVRARERGKGVGTALLAAVLAQAALDGHRRLSLSVEPDNPALRLYERLGFARHQLDDGAWTMLAQLLP